MDKLKYFVMAFLIWLDEKVFIHYYPQLCSYISFHPWLELAPYRRVHCIRVGQVPILDYDRLMEMPWEKFLVEVLRDAPENDTYREAARWLAGRFSQEQIIGMYAKLYAQLADFVFTDPRNINKYYEKEDYLRDQMDVFWYAIKDRATLEKVIIPIWEDKQNSFRAKKEMASENFRQVVNRLNNQ